MKSIKLMLACCALAAAGLQAQNTGLSIYGHSGINALLSSGTYVGNNPGFIMGGYIPAISSTGQPNFMIDKTDDDGSFNSGTDFSRQYAVVDGGTACTPCLRPERRCYGVSVIEAQGGNPAASYAATAIFDGGVLFTRLSTSGAVLNSAFYNLPSGAVPNYKPLIAQSATGDYYLVGSFFSGVEDKMYVMKVDAAGTQAWSSLYSAGVTSGTFVARGIVEDNYASSGLELAIVGSGGSSVSTDGFIITIDGASGTPNMQVALASGQTVNDDAWSVSLAASNSGYIVGGFTQASPLGQNAWMMRLFANGTFDWTSRIQPSTNPTAGEVLAVRERFSTVYNDYEYYGLAISNSSASGGMLVLKLDNNGNAFSKPGNPDNEFLYNSGSGTPALSGDMSVLDQGPAANNTGIHVFGTDQFNPGQFLLNQAVFNGATGTCNNPTQQDLTVLKTVAPGPSVNYNFNSTITSGLTPCFEYYVTFNCLNYAPVQPCSVLGSMPSSPYGGSNNRSSGTTGLATHGTASENGLSIYPNPTSNVTEIKYTAEKAGDVKISISDALGKEIRTLDNGYKKEGANALQIDLNSLNIQTGIYFINVTANGTTTQQKIIYTKN